MKVYMKPVKMISVSEEDGFVTPIKFQMKNEEKEYITVKIDSIVLREEEKLAGNRMLIFRCQSNFSGLVKVFELKYELNSMKWYLYKI